MSAEKSTITIVVSRAAKALDAWCRERGLSDRELAPYFGVSHGAVHGWRSGRIVPSREHQAQIELFCAVIDPVTNKTAIDDGTGLVVSRVPLEWWLPEGAELPKPKPIVPYDAQLAEAP
jgi:transcriptional regulator with XRE-family HTH domain